MSIIELQADTNKGFQIDTSKATILANQVVGFQKSVIQGVFFIVITLVHIPDRYTLTIIFQTTVSHMWLSMSNSNRVLLTYK